MNPPHNFSRTIGKNGTFRYCPRCGLIALSNDATRKAIQKGCYEALLIEKEERERKVKK